MVDSWSGVSAVSVGMLLAPSAGGARLVEDMTWWMMRRQATCYTSSWHLGNPSGIDLLASASDSEMASAIISSSVRSSIVS